MLYGMAYLPLGEVPPALEIIRATMPTVGQPLVDYFEHTYVNGPTLRRTVSNAAVFRPPMFPPDMWNVADHFEQELPTTSNHVEAWHRRIQTLIVVDHPSFFTCLQKLREEQRHTEVALTRAENGFRAKRQRRSMTEHNRRVMTLMSDFRCGRKDIATFLRGIGNAFGSTGHFRVDGEGDEEAQRKGGREVDVEIEVAEDLTGREDLEEPIQRQVDELR